MKKFIDTGQFRTSSVEHGNILIGAHGKGHLGSVSPARQVTASSSACNTNSAPAGKATLELSC